MENQKFETAALKTAKWWSQKAFRTPMNQNNGDDSPSGGLAFMLMNTLSIKAQETVTDEKIAAFEKKLVELIGNYHHEYPWNEVTLNVDYGPDPMLREAAESAGLNTACFPCKTYTVIELDYTAKASYQYRGPLLPI